MSNRVSLYIKLIISVVITIFLSSNVARAQNFSVSNKLDDTDLIRIEFQYKNGIPIPILKQYKDRLILQIDGRKQEIKLPKKSKLFFDGGSFLGLLQKEDFIETNPAKIECSVYSIEGRKIWTVSEDLIWDQYAPDWIIDPINGAALKIESSFGKVTHFDSEGRPIQINVFNVSEHDYERILIGAFSPLGGFFAVAGQTQENIKSNSSTLILFDEQLKMVFEKSLIQNKLTQLKFSKDGKQIGLSGYHLSDNGTVESKITQVIDKRGNLISSYPVLSDYISFSEDGRNVAFTDGKTIFYSDLNNGELVWKKQLGENGRMITNISISSNGNNVAVLSSRTEYQNLTYIYNDLELVLLDSKGTLLHEEQYADRSVIKPTLHTSPDGISIAVGFKNGWSILKRLDK